MILIALFYFNPVTSRESKFMVEVVTTSLPQVDDKKSSFIQPKYDNTTQKQPPNGRDNNGENDDFGTILHPCTYMLLFSVYTTDILSTEHQN